MKLKARKSGKKVAGPRRKLSDLEVFRLWNEAGAAAQRDNQIAYNLFMNPSADFQMYLQPSGLFYVDGGPSYWNTVQLVGSEWVLR